MERVSYKFWAFMATLRARGRVQSETKGGAAMKRTTVWLTSSQTEGLEALSKKTGTKQAELIRRALDDFLKKYSPKK
jgi:hypothetical protein